MANYTATTRSNYFRVKNAAAFEDWCKSRSLQFWQHTRDGLGRCYGVTADTGDVFILDRAKSGRGRRPPLCLVGGHPQSLRPQAVVHADRRDADLLDARI